MTESRAATTPPTPSAGPDLRTLRLTAPLVRAGLIGGLALASGVALTATSGWLIVKADERPIILTLLTAIVAVRAFGMARPALRYWERLVTHDAALADLQSRRVQTYAALVPLTPARLGRRGRADLLTGVVEDLDDVVGAQIRVSVPGLSAVIALGLTALVTALFDVRIGVLVVVLSVIIALISGYAYRLELADNARLGQARADVTRVAALITEQGDQVRAVGGAGAILAELDRAQSALAATVLRQARGRALAAGLILLAVGGAAVAVALVLAGDPGRHTPPVAALLVLTPVAAADALTPLAEAAKALARARGSADRLRRVLTQVPAVADPQNAQPSPQGPERVQPGASAAHLDLAGVSARWDQDRALALQPVDLDVAPGTRLVITGPNGSGKSTLLAVLARHLDPSTGSYAVGGTEVRTLPLAEVRGRIAIVDDSPHVFASSLRENLRFAASANATDEDLIAALDRVGLSEWFAGLPGGLDTRLGTGGRGLSGGERARVSIARALLSGRPVLLLDEPVAHLDSATARAVIDDLLAASQRQTVIMVSHREDGRAGFDRTLALTPPDATAL